MMASDRQPRLQQLLLDVSETRLSRAAEVGRTRLLINETGSAIARALRNELTVVSGNVELIGMKHVSDAVHRFAVNAQLAAESATRVLHRLSLLDRIGKGHRSGIDAHRELVSLRSQLEHQVRTDIQMKWAVEPSRYQLLVDPEEFRMILSEVLQNALEAMPTGGTLSITSSELRLQASLQQDTGWWLAIEVCDTGTGMSESQCMTALAPVSRVNGQAKLALGLCLLDRFVAELEGILDISSLEDQGTTITLLLPLQTKHHVSDSDNDSN